MPGCNPSSLQPPEFVVSPATTGGAVASFTWTGVALGRNQSDKRVYVAISWSAGSTRTLNSMSIAGVTATRVIRAVDAASTINLEIWQADVATNTGDVTCTWNGSTSGSTIAVYAAYGVVSGAIFSSDKGHLTTSSSTITATVNTKENTIVLVAFRFNSSSATLSLTNAIDDTPSVTYSHFGHVFNLSAETGRVIIANSSVSVQPRTMLVVVIEL